MARNKKTKVDYQRKANLLLKCDVYKAENKKLPISEEEYQDLKDEMLILENRYPSIKKIADDSVIRAEQKYPDGRIYKGAIKSAEQQIPHGHGFMCLSKYESDPESKTFGKKLTDNPWDYIGEFKEGVFDGQGEFICEGDYSYKGEWSKSHFNGKGKLTYKKTNEIYEGEFVNDKKNGYGVLIVDNKFKSEGQWKDNELHGKCKITFFEKFEQHEKGKIMEGNFKNGLWHGVFKISYSDGEVKKVKYNMGVHTNEKKEASKIVKKD